MQGRGIGQRLIRPRETEALSPNPRQSIRPRGDTENEDDEPETDGERNGDRRAKSGIVMQERRRERSGQRRVPKEEGAKPQMEEKGRRREEIGWKVRARGRR